MRTVVTLALAVFAGLTVACSDESAPAPVPVQLALPPLDPRLQSLGEGALDLQVAARSKQSIDPLGLARQLGTPPTCADFVFLFSWRTASGETVRFTGNRQGGDFDIDSGASGQASIGGCILIEAFNGTDKAISGDLRYIIAQIRH